MQDTPCREQWLVILHNVAFELNNTGASGKGTEEERKGKEEAADAIAASTKNAKEGAEATGM